MLLMVQRMCSALPFCGEVYEQDIRRITPLVAKNTRESIVELTTSVALGGFDGAAKLCGDI
jgi:hypothetical protein